MNIQLLKRTINGMKQRALYYTRPHQLFNQHFRMDHQFHGILSHRVHESFTITPISEMGIFVFYDDIQFMKLIDPSFIKVTRFTDRLTVQIQVSSERDSIRIKHMVIKLVLSHFVRFVDRFEQDERIKYVAQFCSGCRKYKSLPLTKCVLQCRYEPTSVDNSMLKHQPSVPAISTVSEC